MEGILFKLYRKTKNGKISTTPTESSNFINSFHSFSMKMVFLETTYINVLHVKIL